MTFTPRPYQQEAHDAIINSWRRSLAPCLVEAATGAGKSIILAMVAKTLNEISNNKRVLCLAPSKELTEQNAEKYASLGEPFSFYSASIQKSLRHPVVFATPGTFVKVASVVGGQFGGVIIDEAHNTTPTIKKIVADMQAGNPNLRVCGLTATPYRLNDGYIYAVDQDLKPVEATKEPYYYQLVYSITARELIDMGFLTPLVAAPINATSYDTSGLILKPNGQYDEKTVRAAFEGWGRETAAIIADVVGQTQNATGTLIFAATVQHAKEVMASLHPDNARIITGETTKKEREKIISDFKKQKFQYLVNVSVLTTGFDAPNVSHIAILRASESVGLLQQMFGRAMRLFAGKKQGVILDYANNLERHFPDGDLYIPEVKVRRKKEESETINCLCEKCGKINTFTERENEYGMEVDAYGYYVLPGGERYTREVLDGQTAEIPAHYGRRCIHIDSRGNQCDYYWSGKDCPFCNFTNDISARYCGNCKGELINPNDRLITLYKEHQRDPNAVQTEKLLELRGVLGISRNGNAMVTCEVKTERRTFKVFLLEANQWLSAKKAFVERATNNFTTTPATISYRRVNDFWEIVAFDRPTDFETFGLDKLN